jgi:hypothetical protein
MFFFGEKMNILAVPAENRQIWRHFPPKPVKTPKKTYRDLKRFLETKGAREVFCAVPGLFWCAGWRRSHLTCF